MIYQFLSVRLLIGRERLIMVSRIETLKLINLMLIGEQLSLIRLLRLVLRLIKLLRLVEQFVRTLIHCRILLLAATKLRGYICITYA